MIIIKYLYAVVADAAMGTAWGSVELTSGAPLHTYCDAFYINVLIERCTEVIITDFVIMSCTKETLKVSEVYMTFVLTSGIGSRVHECCHGEIRNDEDRENAFIDGDGE